MRSLILLSAVSVALSLSATAAPVTLTLNVMNGPAPFSGQLQTSAGQTINTTLWQLYVSNVALVRADGSEVRLPGLSLVKLGGEAGYQNLPVLKTFAPAGNYRGLRFDIGVPRDLNHRDASTQKAPLGLDVGMFWAWNPGYIFSRYEGKAQLGNQTLDVYLHMGGDPRRLTVDFADLMKPGTAINVVEGQPNSVALQLDAAKMVATGVGGQPFDLTDARYVQVHGGAVADQLYLNLSTAFSLGGAPAAGEMVMPAGK